MSSLLSGTRSCAPELVTGAMRETERELFLRDRRDGAFPSEWSVEQAGGSNKLEALLQAALSHAMSRAEFGVIDAMQGSHSMEGDA